MEDDHEELYLPEEPAEQYLEHMLDVAQVAVHAAADAFDVTKGLGDAIALLGLIPVRVVEMGRSVFDRAQIRVSLERTESFSS